ncbi:MAG: hypothetical protein NUV64_00450 [Parcubacteria group bacterium]|nr:hypothetical protein [Parcubacteria group bacterium]MCR4342516.1 hypothetical protein [Patescibacteria group bacterium]
MKFFYSHKWFIFLFIFLVIFLSLKAIPKDSWDDWGFGSAQTMMSSRHWVKDGFIHSKFLFLPMGYSKSVRYLDGTDMRHLTRGTMTGKLIGSRLYYTHYPAGYLLPYATLMKIGFSERFWFRFLAILISLAGISLMYAGFSLISTRMIAFLATLYYAGSTMFLGIADSLANQPIDDLFRFSILFLSVWIYKISDDKKKRLYNIFIWFLYFALAGSSYDSTFFVFVWLVGLDLVMTKKILWKKWLIFATAPVMAFLVQLLQNLWYLGVHDALLDIYGSFRARANTGPGTNVFEKHIRAIFSPWVYMTDLRARFIIPIIVVLFSIFVFLKRHALKNLYNFPKNEILVLLAISGFAYPFILVSSGYFPYQARQAALFISLLLASATVLIFLIAKDIKTFRAFKSDFQIKRAMALLILVILVSLLWFKQADRTYAYIKQWPNNVVDEKIIKFGQDMRDVTHGRDSVIFRMEKTSSYRYPQADPFLEYYAGMPILSFKDTKDLADDLIKLKNRSVYSFLPIIIADDKEIRSIKEFISGNNYGEVYIK